MSNRDKSEEVERSESEETIDEEDNLNCAMWWTAVDAMSIRVAAHQV